MINRKTLEKARDWARSTTGVAMKEVRAAEEVIESLPDSWIDADELRAVLEEWEYEPADPAHAHKFFRAVEALLPAPSTMADIEWKDEEHHLAEATTAEGEAVIMLAEESTDTGEITGVIYCANKRGEVDGWQAFDLTPTGWRFHLVPTGWKQLPEPEASPAKPEASPTKPPYRALGLEGETK